MTASSLRNFSVAILINFNDCHYIVTEGLHKSCLVMQIFFFSLNLNLLNLTRNRFRVLVVTEMMLLLVLFSSLVYEQP